MTFSMVGRCNNTGEVGSIVSSSSICVASRCAFVRTGVGAALSQSVTDPRLGPDVLDALEAGCSASDALDRVIGVAQHVRWRQLLAIGLSGVGAVYSGQMVLGRYAAALGTDCVSAGNLLANERVPAAMIETFEKTSGTLAERLLTALESGLEAGGETGPVHSAGLMVAGRVAWPHVDLRVDWSVEPVKGLRDCWREYAPQLETYLKRAEDPDSLPSDAVPGNTL